VARVKSTARPMTTEELAAAGLPAEPVAQNPGNVQPPEEQASPAASESKSHENGEVRTDDEDVGDCRMDLPRPTTFVGTRTDYSVGPWDYPTCAARHLLA
jgi:hypothetical protein